MRCGRRRGLSTPRFERASANHRRAAAGAHSDWLGSRCALESFVCACPCRKTGSHFPGHAASSWFDSRPVRASRARVMRRRVWGRMFEPCPLAGEGGERAEAQRRQASRVRGLATIWQQRPLTRPRSATLRSGTLSRKGRGFHRCVDTDGKCANLISRPACARVPAPTSRRSDRSAPASHRRA
jgi:hypothetical protein